MTNKKIIVLVPLNIGSYDEEDKVEDAIADAYLRYIDQRGKDEVWIKNRINVFMNYTCKSLINQTNQDFTALVVYDDKTEEVIISELKNYGDLPENIIFIGKSIADKFIKEKIAGSEYAYFVRIDSDDMYHKSYIQKLYDYIPLKETAAIINEWAYLYDSFNNKLYVCHAKILSSYTLIYKTEEYRNDMVPSVITNMLDAQMENACHVLKNEEIEGINYIWHVHSKNTITSTEEWFTNQWTNYLSEPIENEIIKGFILSEFRG
jgi:GT2 family glycosyltransferase